MHPVGCYFADSDAERAWTRYKQVTASTCTQELFRTSSPNRISKAS